MPVGNDDVGMEIQKFLKRFRRVACLADMLDTKRVKDRLHKGTRIPVVVELQHIDII